MTMPSVFDKRMYLREGRCGHRCPAETEAPIETVEELLLKDIFETYMEY